MWYIPVYAGKSLVFNFDAWLDETRNTKPETRNPKPGIRNSKPLTPHSGLDVNTLTLSAPAVPGQHAQGYLTHKKQRPSRNLQ